MGKMVKSVEELNIDLASVVVGSGILSKGQTTSNCVPFGSCYSSTNTDYWYYTYRDIKFSTTGSSGTVEIQRTNASTTTLYNTVYIVEFDPAEVRVQQGTFTFSNPNTSTTVSGFTPVDPTKTALIFYNSSTSSSRNTGYHAIKGVITDSGTLTFEVGIAGSTVSGHWYLMEDLGGHFTVTQYATNFASSATYEYTVPTKYHQNLVITSYKYTNGDGNPTHSQILVDTGSQYRLYYLKPYNTSACYTNSFIIKFNKSADVYMSQRHCCYLDTSVNSRTIYYQDTVTSGFSMVMHNVPSVCTGYTSNQTDSAIYCMTTRVKLGSTLNEVLVTRAGNNSQSIYADHQLFDWSESFRSEISPQPKLDALSEINSMVKSVEHFSCTFSGTDSYYDTCKYIQLNKGQNIKNCVPFATHRSSGGSGYNNYILADYQMMEPDRIAVFREHRCPNVINCEIDVVEFESDQVRVQQGYFLTTSGTADITISGVDLTKAAARAYNITNNYVQGGCAIYGWGKVKFTSSGVLQYQRNVSDGMVGGNYYVFEALADQFSVISYDYSGGTPATYLTNPLEFNRSFLLTSYYLGSTDGNLQHNFTYTSSFPNLGYLVSNKYSGSQTTYHTTFVITLKQNPNHPHNVLTQHYFNYFGSGDLTQNFHLRHAVTSGTAVVLNAPPYAGGYTFEGNAGYAEHVFATYKLNGLNQVDLQRNVTNSAAIRNAVQVVDFVGFPIDTYAIIPHGTNDLVWSTEHFDFTISGTSNFSKDYMWHLELTKGQNIDYCVPFLSYRLDSGTVSSNYTYRSAVVIDNGELHIIKAGPGTEYYSVDVVEFNPTRVRIQRGTLFINNGSSTQDVTISGIDATKTFVYFSYYTQYDSNLYGTNHFVKASFTSTTNLRFSRSGTGGAMMGSWWVVESLDGAFTVDHGNFTLDYTGYDTVPSQAYNIRRSIVIASATFNNVDTNPVHNCNRIYLADASPDIRATADRGGNTATYTVASQTITFAASENIKAQQGFFTMTAGTDSSKSHALGSPVTSGRYALFTPNLYSYPYVTHGDTNHILSDICRYTLVSGGAYIKAERRSTSYTTYNTYMLIEFPESHQYYFSGDVLEQGLPVERGVRAYRRDTGELMNTTMSMSGTGAFYVDTTYSGEHYVVCVDDVPGNVYNALIYDYVVPVTIS